MCRLSARLTLILTLALASMASVMQPGVAAQERAPWQMPSIPENAMPLAIDGQMGVNGAPLNVRGFMSPESPQAVMRQLVQSSQLPMVRSSRGHGMTLTSVREGNVLTIVIDPAGSGSRVLMSMSSVPDIRKAIGAKAAPRWMSAMPYDATVLTDVESVLPEETSRTTLVKSHLAVDVVTDRLVEGMRAEGFSKVRETNVDTDTLALKGRSGLERDARALTFEGTGAQVQATVHGDSGVTYAVITSARPRNGVLAPDGTAGSSGLVTFNDGRSAR